MLPVEELGKIYCSSDIYGANVENTEKTLFFVYFSL